MFGSSPGSALVPFGGAGGANPSASPGGPAAIEDVQQGYPTWQSAAQPLAQFLGPSLLPGVSISPEGETMVRAPQWV